MEEMWVDIEGYKGLYQVSNTGKVRRIKWHGFSKIGYNELKPSRVGKALYQRVNLSKNDVSKSMYVHRLVAQAFLPNPENLPEVNHKDENPANNHVSNLEWCTCKQNCNYGKRGERIAEKLRNDLTRKKPVLQYSIDGVLIARYASAKEASVAVNGDKSSICTCANGKVKTAVGYKWKWENKE